METLGNVFQVLKEAALGPSEEEKAKIEALAAEQQAATEAEAATPDDAPPENTSMLGSIVNTVKEVLIGPSMESKPVEGETMVRLDFDARFSIDSLTISKSLSTEETTPLETPKMEGLTHQVGEKVEELTHQVGEKVEELKEATVTTAAATKETVVQWAEIAKESATERLQSAKDAANAAMQAAQEKVEAVKQTAVHAGEVLKEGTEALPRKLDEWVEVVTESAPLEQLPEQPGPGRQETVVLDAGVTKIEVPRDEVPKLAKAVAVAERLMRNIDEETLPRVRDETLHAHNPPAPRIESHVNEHARTQHEQKRKAGALFQPRHVEI